VKKYPLSVELGGFLLTMACSIVLCEILKALPLSSNNVRMFIGLVVGLPMSLIIPFLTKKIYDKRRH
jgi:hypothetical protein